MESCNLNLNIFLVNIEAGITASDHSILLRSGFPSFDLYLRTNTDRSNINDTKLCKQSLIRIIKDSCAQERFEAIVLMNSLFIRRRREDGSNPSPGREPR